MHAVEAKYYVGQTIHHRLFDYRGVVVDVDPNFQGTEEWYESMARSRPPKNRPWYRVLVHDAGIETYVAERNLEEDNSGAPINHPYVSVFFSDFRDGTYVLSRDSN